MTGRPIYCARCPRLAVVIVEAGTPTSRTRRAATACPRHTAALRRWCARSGTTRLIHLRQPATVQPTLFDLPEVTA
jgi:hypothetical protein